MVRYIAMVIMESLSLIRMVPSLTLQLPFPSKWGGPKRTPKN